ncbi:MAG: hypothetical protein V3U29_03310 [Phycisphaeraceae bacterium]
MLFCVRDLIYVTYGRSCERGAAWMTYAHRAPHDGIFANPYNLNAGPAAVETE